MNNNHTRLFKNDDFRQAFDAKAEAMNVLNDKLLDAGIDSKYIDNLIDAAEECEKQKILAIINMAFE